MAIITSSHGERDVARLTLLTPNVFLIPPTPVNVLIFFHRLFRLERRALFSHRHTAFDFLGWLWGFSITYLALAVFGKNICLWPHFKDLLLQLQEAL